MKRKSSKIWNWNKTWDTSRHAVVGFASWFKKPWNIDKRKLIFVGAKKYLWMENLEIPPCTLVRLMREAPRDKRVKIWMCWSHWGVRPAPQDAWVPAQHQYGQARTGKWSIDMKKGLLNSSRLSILFKSQRKKKDTVRYKILSNVVKFCGGDLILTFNFT